MRKLILVVLVCIQMFCCFASALDHNDEEFEVARINIVIQKLDAFVKEMETRGEIPQNLPSGFVNLDFATKLFYQYGNVKKAVDAGILLLQGRTPQSKGRVSSQGDRHQVSHLFSARAEPARENQGERVFNSLEEALASGGGVKLIRTETGIQAVDLSNFIQPTSSVMRPTATQESKIISTEVPKKSGRAGLTENEKILLNILKEDPELIGRMLESAIRLKQ